MLSSLAFDAGAFDNLAFLFEEISVSVSESATASDSSARSIIGSAAIAEAASAADSRAAIASLLAVRSESATAADSSTGISGGGAFISEAANSADASTTSATRLAAISEAASASDQGVTGGLSSATRTEAATAGDSLAITAALAGAIVEAVAANDSAVGASLPGAVAAVEGINAGDTITLTAEFVAYINETVLASDSSVSGGTTTGDRMPYTTRAQLDNAFGALEVANLLDRDNDGSEDVGVLAYAIANADALIDAYLASRYEVPLVEVPQLVAIISSDITRFLLWNDKAPEEVRKRYEERIKQLEKIQQGYLSLPSTVPASISAEGGVGFVETEAVFSMTSLAGF